MANKKVGIDIGVNVSGNAADAMQKIASKIADAEKKIKDATKYQSRAEGKAAGGASGGGSGGKVTTIGGAYGGFISIVDKVGNALNSIKDPSLSAAQSLNALVDELVPGAATVRKFMEAVDGTTARLQANSLAYEQAKRDQEIQSQAEQRISTLQREANAAASKVSGSNSVPMAAYEGGKFDRGTVSGERDYADYGARLGAADRRREAQQEANAAKTDVTAQRGRVEAITKRLRDAEAATKKSGADFRGAVAGEASGTRNKDGIDTKGKQQELNLQVVSDLRKQREEEINALKEKGVAAAQAESQVRKADIASAQTELNILKQKEARMAGAQQRLGAMNKGQFEAAKQAALYLKENGIENATSELIDLARQAAPETVNKMAEKAGAGRAAELGAAGLDEYKADYARGAQSLGDVRAQVNNLEANVRVQVDIDTKALAADIAKELAASTAGLKASILADVTLQYEKLAVGMKLRNNANH